MSDRLTASVHGPTSGQRSLHLRQNTSVRSNASRGSIRPGGLANEGPYDRTKGTDWPAPTTNSPTVLRSSPWRVAGVRRTRRSGPAIASIVLSAIRVTHGTVDP